MLRWKVRGLCRRMTDDERRSGCGGQRGELATLSLSTGDVPARKAEWWWPGAIRAEDCAAQPGLTGASAASEATSAASRVSLHVCYWDGVVPEPRS